MKPKKSSKWPAKQSPKGQELTPAECQQLAAKLIAEGRMPTFEQFMQSIVVTIQAGEPARMVLPLLAALQQSVAGATQADDGAGARGKSRTARKRTKRTA
jgi:hypothetical protein